MVQALIDISGHANRILNIIKAKYGLKDKSQAIELAVGEYEKNIMEPEFRPEFVEEIQRISKGRFRKIKSLDELLR